MAIEMALQKAESAGWAYPNGLPHSAAHSQFMPEGKSPHRGETAQALRLLCNELEKPCGPISQASHSA
jgi:hypothetical protein